MYGTKVEGSGTAEEWCFTCALLPVHSEEQIFDEPPPSRMLSCLTLVWCVR